MARLDGRPFLLGTNMDVANDGDRANGTFRTDDDPTLIDERLWHALSQLYLWYAWAEPMLANVFRDQALVPAVARAGEGFRRQFAGLHGVLMRGRQKRGRVGIRVAAAIGHALSFGTWRSLIRDGGLETDEAVELMAALVAAARTGAAAYRSSPSSSSRSSSAPSSPTR